MGKWGQWKVGGEYLHPADVEEWQLKEAVLELLSAQFSSVDSADDSSVDDSSVDDSSADSVQNSVDSGHD